MDFLTPKTAMVDHPEEMTLAALAKSKPQPKVGLENAIDAGCLKGFFLLWKEDNLYFDSFKLMWKKALLTDYSEARVFLFLISDFRRNAKMLR